MFHEIYRQNHSNHFHAVHLHHAFIHLKLVDCEAGGHGVVQGGGGEQGPGVHDHRECQGDEERDSQMKEQGPQPESY